MENNSSLYIITVITIINYIFSRIGGALFSVLISSILSVGASIAIYGLLGAYVFYYLLF